MMSPLELSGSHMQRARALCLVHWGLHILPITLLAANCIQLEGYRKHSAKRVDIVHALVFVSF